MSAGSTVLPTSGSMSATAFVGLVNIALAAGVSTNSGTTAPANAAGNLPAAHEQWMDTTNPLFVADRVFDGAAAWPRRGSIDTASSIYCPQLGGGLSSVASASTVNLGAIAATFVTITGTTPITNFGVAAQNGEMKVVYCGGAFQITNSANIICPGNENLNVNVGDTFWAVYDGSAVWLILNFNRANGSRLRTGTAFWMYGTGAIPGAVRANGNTIGNTGSNATELAGPTALNLFNQVWAASASDPEITFLTSAGGASVRGASAAADWAALKQMKLPDLCGRTVVGLDNAGRTGGAAGRLTSSSMAPDGITCGAVGGSEMVTLSTSTMPSHAHPGTTSTDAGHHHTFTGQEISAAGGGPNGVADFNSGSQGTTNNSAVITTTVASQGGGAPHLNMQPSKAGTWYMAL